jgi:parvulin-like peptidyl-prolyl isomerase
MARRERTTALPRARQRAAAHQTRRTLGERRLQLGVIGVAVVLLLAVLGAFAYRVYDTRVGIPQSTVLQVADEKFSLRYYADRLGPFIQANLSSGQSLAIIEERLLTKLEEEALTLILAREAGVDLSDQAVLQFIADQLGVPVGGSGTSFDTLYRNQLRTLGIDDGTYKRMKQAELADARLMDLIKEEIGTSGDQYTVRVVLVGDQETAAGIRGRIEAGEDMGTIAQVESLDLESRQNDGILPPEPLPLFPESAREAMEGAAVGTLLGPVQVGDNWWVFRIEAIEERDYSDAQAQQLADKELADRITAKRAELAGRIRRSLDADDIEWAEERVSLPEGS